MIFLDNSINLAIQNNLDLVFSSFSHILGPLFKVFGLSSEIQAYHEEFVGLISSLLLSGLNLVEEKELSTSIVKTVVGSLHKVHTLSSEMENI